MNDLCDEQVDVFNDEHFGECSEEIEQEQANTPFLTSMFQIVPSSAERKRLFHILNNLFFAETRNIKDLRKDICNYIIKEHFISS